MPAAYAPLFAHDPQLLTSHRGWDAGAAQLARRFARRLRAPLIEGRCSRLLVDLNRSERHPRLFSEGSRALPAHERAALLDRFHREHRAAVEAAIAGALLTAARVVHLSVHSFTPHWDGRARPTQLGLLDDPHRPRERALSRAWRAELLTREPQLRVHLNRPYRGWTDGLVSLLRRRHPASRYLGFELEFNQAHLAAAPAWVDTLCATMSELRAEASGSR
ncbi:MAG: hypothetical protein DHS20C15_04500 [Planctomycetota bacterium]|nr:MAG: hypothetical protein DHS20C15_04500 [Planctomycetota bacterium]